MTKKPPTYNDLNRTQWIDLAPDTKFDPTNVVKEQCSSCPFRPYGEGIGSTEMTAEEYYKKQATLTASALSDSSQFCHAPALVGGRQNQVCRGARDIQKQVFYRLGVLEAPTDEAWKKALNDMENQK